MLSILIPTYNYPISNLLKSLDKVTIGFDYEILCCEDGSKLYIDENKTVCHSTKNTTYLYSKENKGRITSRKFLAEKAKYDWLLFLDADVAITNDNFINDYYSKYFTGEYDAIYGGCSYDLNRPDDSQVLRWKYGKTYEEVEAKTRNKSPYKFIVSANFLIKKETFFNLISKINGDGYGYDLLLGALMKSDNTKVFHVDNPVIHKGLDKNSVFIDKVEKAVETNYKLFNDNKINSTENSLLETFKTIKKIGLIRPISSIYKLSRSRILKQLMSNNPNMKILQFYKLGYLCHLSANTK
ncbi:glycosyltransferase family 2 protein [Winogradskyella sp.]|uniref:glycosyltransferase family 2 protein n=1 Tax=Winogradskyella sp. TaxID=1883156 RepID=UPI0035169476